MEAVLTPQNHKADQKQMFDMFIQGPENLYIFVCFYVCFWIVGFILKLFSVIFRFLGLTGRF